MLRTSSDPRTNRRIDSWKEIASFFRRDERTVKRWEKTKFLPVHRIPASERGGVFAYTAELTGWLNTPLPAKRSFQKTRSGSRLEAATSSAAEPGSGSPARARLVIARKSDARSWQVATAPVPAAPVGLGSGKNCSIYTKRQSGSTVSYSFLRPSRLFGWNSAWDRGGWLPFLLQQHIAAAPGRGTPAWHIRSGEIRRALANDTKGHGGTFVIEFRPNRTDHLLCEIVQIWGYSTHAWTPMMLHLKQLVDGPRDSMDAYHFSVPANDPGCLQPIFTMIYTPDGFTTEGKVMGKWSAPAQGPMSSALLWPPAFEYFANEAKKVL